jgi:superfamily I DNA and RNA helicase
LDITFSTRNLENKLITTIWGTTKKPVSSDRLASFFGRFPDLEGTLYIGYPIIGTPEGAFPIDAMLISPSKGILLFDLIEGRDETGYAEKQDDGFNKFEAKLKNHRTLMQGRTLRIALNIATFAPALPTGKTTLVDYPLLNEDCLKKYYDEIGDGEQAYSEAVAVIQSISTIRKGRKKREIKNPESRGAKLKNLEDSIANLDNLQGRAVIETVEGVQRIRGLAGSGKTIILALKAAYLHARHPEWKIAVTFHTRALKGQLRRLINTFHIEQTNEEPDWGNLHILQSWGAPGSAEKNGIYYTYCKQAGTEYFDLTGARNRFPRREFEGVCKNAIEEKKVASPVYDAILVDEAQDLSAHFLQICYQLLSEKKRLIYAYDELQNLNSSSLPPPEEIFGVDATGRPNVQFLPPEPGKPQQDVILEMCYRNSRPVLATAHALGFGIYRDVPKGQTTGLIQMFDQSSLWLEVGYKATEGSLEDGRNVTLERTLDSSPRFLEQHSEISDLVQFHCFSSAKEQAEWVADQVSKNIENDELEPGDIIVINPEPFSTRNVVGPIRKILFEREIQSHLAGVDTSPDIFFDEEGKSVAFTGIYRAKGNEAGMVYIINAQDCQFSLGGMATLRNRLFTAITRSKAWVRVVGFGDGMQKLIDEFEKVKAQDFKLKFKYPTAEERKHLNIVNRDKDVRVVREGAKNFEKVLKELQSGRVAIEDLPPEQVEFLRKLLIERDQGK